MPEIQLAQDLVEENRELQRRLAEAEETLQAIRNGQVDALVVDGANGAQVFTLNGAEHSYRVMIENISEGAFTMTDEGFIIYSNRRFAAMLKSVLEKVIGSNIRDWIHLPDYGLFQTLLPGTAHGVQRGEINLRSGDGTLVPAILSADTLQAENDHLICLVATDLSEQKHNEAVAAAEKLARAILEQAADAIVVCDHQGRIIRASHTAHDLCGCNPLGQMFTTLFPLRLLDGQFYPYSTMQSGTIQSGIQVTFEAAGGNFQLLMSIAPVQTDGDDQLGFVAIFTDITQLRRAEAERDLLHEDLKRHAQELEARVIERTVELEQRMTQLRLLVNELTFTEHRERRRMAHILHDDLQQLLFAAKLEVEVVHRSTIAGSMREQLDYAIKGLEDAILTSRNLAIELAPPTFQEQQVSLGLKWLASSMQKQYGLVVAVEAGDDVYIPSESLRLLLLQCARELLFNVVKHAQAQKAELYLTHLNEHMLELRITDHGVGFEPSAVVHAGSKESSFGLFSVKQRLEAAGGSFDIESAPGHGTEARIRLPLETNDLNHEILANQENRIEFVKNMVAQKGTRIRILLVDDHVLIRQALAHALRIEADIELVGEADDGQQAIELASELRPDVVIMDVSMPRVDGVEATRAILAILPQVRIVGLSVHKNADYAAAMSEAGAVAYLTKDNSVPALLSTIRRVYSEKPGAAMPPNKPN